MPDYRAFPAKPYLVAKDGADLYLQPGRTAKKDETYRLSHYDFHLGKGEVVTAFGSVSLKNEHWILLGFSTSTEEIGYGDDSEAGSVGMRYAWMRAADLTPLADYVPNYAKNDPAWMPGGMRGYKTLEPLSDALRTRLLGQGFWIDPKPLIPDHIRVDDMSDLYDATGDFTADFLTADLFLHAYHLIFRGMLKNTEKTYLAPTLEASLRKVLAELDRAARAYAGKQGRSSAMNDSFAAARDILSIPLVLLTDDGKSADIRLSERAAAEIRSIDRAQGSAISRITGQREDYTQYRPSSHYVGDPVLERYFRAVSFLGNAGLRLFDADEDKPNLPNVRTAALIALALDTAGDTWNAYEEPVDFLMGTPDDGKSQVYRDLARKHIGSLGNAGALADGKTATQLAQDIRRNISSPRIRDRETGVVTKEEEAADRVVEFRVSGKRFTFDAYVMNQLTSPRVGTNENPRNLPEGTDTMAVLGSAAADRWARRNDDVESYAETMKGLKEDAAPFLAQEDTAYVRWLRVLRATFEDSGSKQVFYRSDPWQWKKLLTGVSSWAELKHDTVLYAKQSGAEMSGGGDWLIAGFAPPLPLGYVEPDPQAFAAIVAALDRLLDFSVAFAPSAVGEDDGPGYREDYRKRIETFRGLCLTAQKLAKREVADEILSLSDYDDIKRLARSFTMELLLMANANYYGGDWEELRMALVTDVATSFIDGAALHVATGTPRKIFVFVNDRSGGPRVARGYVYSYYEFPGSLAGAGRMTDQEWRKIVYDPDKAEKLRELHPAWYGELAPE